ncbi:helix-hairpin-helix domain-containing protein [Streptomyces sp. NPDC017941]|uniref:helix-hairpin-helix domain-containing protein n=1 Tax=Streptomyces sp. NPDC017941 TaxID=3365018 RepID=UPI0037A6B0A9
MSTESAAAEATEPEAPEAGTAPAGGTAPEAGDAPAGGTAPEAGDEGAGVSQAAGDADAGAPQAAGDADVDAEAEVTGAGAGAAADAEDGGDGVAGDDGAGGAGDGDAAAAVSEAAAELAAQRELRERIEQRKAAKKNPVDAGTALQGTAADLLAAVRAVESGEKPVASAFHDPEPTTRRRPAPAPDAVRRPVSEASSAVAEPAQETVDAVSAVLTEGGAPAALAARAAAVLGESADDGLRANPWQLLRVPGTRLEQVDGFARALLGPDCGPGDERRGTALTVWLLEQAALAGHTALTSAALGAALGQRGVPEPDEAVRHAVAEGDVLVFQDALEAGPGAAPVPPAAAGEDTGDGGEAAVPVQILLGLERYALAEESLADGLARVLNSLPKDDPSSPSPAQWEEAASRASGSAAELIRAVAGHGLVLHTGGEEARAEPAALVTAARALGLRVCAATHGPDGQRRLAGRLGGGAPGAGRADGPGGPGGGVGGPGGPGGSGGPDGSEDADGPAPAGGSGSGSGFDSGGAASEAAVTVAGLLSGRQGPGRDADGAFALDLLVVLDAPQLDVETAATLVESLPDGARLVLSGDPGVLWSAGPGRVFADLLAARCCPQVVSRTPDPGPLGELVSGIGVGELVQVEAPGKEVVIVPVRDAADAIHRTVQLVADSVPRAIGVPAEQTQVITPGHGGAAGTRALNAALKDRLNPGPGRFGGFDPGDRVVYAPVPGRTALGRVVGADPQGLRLDCEGASVVVPKDRVEQAVRHAWAVTAHQAVGRRWPAAVVVLPGDAAAALNRPWIYSAFSRAERHLSVVQGVAQALPQAVAERPAKERTTRLRTLLRPQPQPPEVEG